MHGITVAQWQNRGTSHHSRSHSQATEVQGGDCDSFPSGGTVSVTDSGIDSASHQPQLPERSGNSRSRAGEFINYRAGERPLDTSVAASEPHPTLDRREQAIRLEWLPVRRSNQRAVGGSALIVRQALNQRLGFPPPPFPHPSPLFALNLLCGLPLRLLCRTHTLRRRIPASHAQSSKTTALIRRHCLQQGPGGRGRDAHGRFISLGDRHENST
jgi:hypothetical protein